MNVPLGSRHIAENQLGQLLFLGVVPDAQDVVDAGIQLTAGVIRQSRVHQPLIKTDFAAIRRNFQHIIHRRVNRTAVDFGCTFAQRLHHVLLDFRRLDHYGFKFSLGHWQVQLITGLDIRRFFEHRHQFGKVEELSEPGACTVSGTFGLDFVKRFSVIFLNSSGCLQGSPL